MQNDSQHLITQASRGNDEAIVRLLERHLPPLRAYIRLRMGERIRRWESETDVAQSVCVDVLSNLGRFTYQGEAAFRQWLFTAALRKLVEMDRNLTAAKRNVDLHATHAPGSTFGDPMDRFICRALGTPSKQAVGREMLDRIERALDTMTENEREVILLSRLAGLSNADIADKMEKNEKAVRVMLCRALAHLAERLEEKGG